MRTDKDATAVQQFRWPRVSIITGPTGPAKSSSASLFLLNLPPMKLSTIGDPVELPVDATTHPTVKMITRKTADKDLNR